MKVFDPKQPSEIMDYDFDFTDFLASRGGDTITDAVVVAAAGITLESTMTINGQLVKVYVSGGANGQKYKLTCTAQTLGGRVAELDAMLPIKEI